MTSPIYASKVQPPKAASNLSNLGFTLLQGDPIDFELQTLDGNQWHLRDAHGKWLLLAFWATWCGPCNQEMPELENLYEKFKKNGLAVAGVSVDQEREPIEEFRKQKNITFPLMHDAQGTVSSKYRASALPTLYVISPEGKLAGVLQGAREWRSPEVMGQISALLENREYKGSENGLKMSADEDGLSLPNNLLPPSLSVAFESDEIRSGETIPFNVTVTWKGNPKDYVIKPPKITLPADISQGDVSSSTTSASQETSLRYTFPLKIAKQGKYKVGPIELAFSPRVGGKELFARDEGITIETKSPNWHLPALVAVGSLAVVGLLILLTKRKRRPQISPRFASRNWSEPYDEIRRLKMQGKRAEYTAGLLKLCSEIETHEGTENKSTKNLLERLKFSGMTLSDADLSTFEKRVERAIAAQSAQMEEPS